MGLSTLRGLFGLQLGGMARLNMTQLGLNSKFYQDVISPADSDPNEGLVDLGLSNRL